MRWFLLDYRRIGRAVEVRLIGTSKKSWQLDVDDDETVSLVETVGDRPQLIATPTECVTAVGEDEEIYRLSERGWKGRVPATCLLTHAVTRETLRVPSSDLPLDENESNWFMLNRVTGKWRWIIGT